jgi:predicted nucleic acid-binding protein
VIFVDSGAWFSAFVPWDVDHPRAAEWLRRNREPLVTTDYVIDGTLTLLRARGERARALALSRHFFEGRLTALHPLDTGDLHAACEVFRRFSDKDWSFTDCTSKVVMERLGVTAAFALDHHFRQFGTVAVVP